MCRSLRDELLRFDQGRKREVLKDRRREERFTAGISFQFRKSLLHRTIAGEHLRDGCNISRLTEDVPECAHEPFDRSLVYLRIDAVHVACGPLRAELFALKNEGAVLPVRDVGAIKSET